VVTRCRWGTRLDRCAFIALDAHLSRVADRRIAVRDNFGVGQSLGGRIEERCGATCRMQGRLRQDAMWNCIFLLIRVFVEQGRANGGGKPNRS
jgi:hypothetical protein